MPDTQSFRWPLDSKNLSRCRWYFHPRTTSEHFPPLETTVNRPSHLTSSALPRLRRRHCGSTHYPKKRRERRRLVRPHNPKPKDSYKDIGDKMTTTSRTRRHQMRSILLTFCPSQRSTSRVGSAWRHMIIFANADSTLFPRDLQQTLYTHDAWKLHNNTSNGDCEFQETPWKGLDRKIQLERIDRQKKKNFI